MNFKNVRFSILFLIADLLLWCFVFLVPTTLLYLSLRQAMGGRDQAVLRKEFQHGAIEGQFRRSELLVFAMNAVGLSREKTLVSLDFPGVIGEVLISLPTTWPATYHPSRLMMDTWRDLTYPILSLPFWWFAGTGWDALFYRRRIRWPFFLLGTLFSVFFIIAYFGLRSVMDSSEREEMVLHLWAVMFWGLLFLPMPIAWFRQWRRSPAVESAS